MVPTLRHPSRSGVALILALGVLSVIAALIMLSLTTAAQTFTDTNRSVHHQGALAAVDAVLSRRETRLSMLALTGDANEFRNWSNLGITAVSGSSLYQDPQGKNYGEDIVGDYRVRWRIEPLVVKSPDSAKFIVNPPAPDDSGAYVVDANNAANETVFLYRLAAEAVLYQRPDDPKLTDPANPLYNTTGYPDNPIMARAQGVRFVGANNIPLFRYVIFYAQKGPKGDLELTHGGTLNVKGTVHSNGAIYLGGNTGTMDWAQLATDSATKLGPTLGADGIDQSSGTSIAGDDQQIAVVGVDGLFNLSKATAYSAFNWSPYMVPVTSADQTWSSTGKYSLTANQPSEATMFPLDDSTSYVDVKTTPSLLAALSTATANGTLLNPYRITDDSGVITTDTLRQINKVVITGSWSSTAAATANDARDAFRRSLGGSTWQTASDTVFNRLAKTNQTGGREVKLDETLLGRPLEPQQLAYVDNPATVIDESQLEDCARPVFRDDGMTPPTANSSGNANNATVREAAGYYLALAMGAGDGSATAYSERHNQTTTLTTATGTTTPGPMTGWTLNAGNAVQSTVGLIIRERYRPRFQDIYPAGAATASAVPPTHPDFMPYAYGKHYRPWTPNPYVPVLVGQPVWTGGDVKSTGLKPSSNSIAYGSSVLQVTAAAEDGNRPSGTVADYLSCTSYHVTPRRLVNIGPAAFDLTKLSYVSVKLAENTVTSTDATLDSGRNIGLAIMPGSLAHANIGATMITAALTTSTTTVALDSADNIVPGTLLILGGVEVVRVKTVNATAKTVDVVRAQLSTAAAAHAVNATVQCTAVQPELCRLDQDVTSTTTTLIKVTSVANLGTNQLLRCATEVMRITTVDVAAKTITVVRGQESTTALNTLYKGTPLHWQGRAPYAALGFAPNRSGSAAILTQRRHLPSTIVPAITTQYWNGGGSAAAPTYTTSYSSGTTTINLTTTLEQSSSVQSSTATSYLDAPVAFSWSSESTTYTVTNYGRKQSTRTEYKRAQARLNLTMQFATVPAGMGFYDITPTRSDSVGDFGRAMRVYGAANQDITIGSGYNSGTSPFSGQIGGTAYYSTAYCLGSTWTYNPTTVPATPADLGASETRYSVAGNAAASTYVHARVVDGSYDASAKTMTVWSVAPALPTNPYTIPSGPWAGWKLSTASTTSLNPSDPGTAYATPTSVPNNWATALGATTSYTTSSALPSRSNVPVSVNRGLPDMDTNGYIARSGHWFDTAQTQYLPAAAKTTTTFSFRPDLWHDVANHLSTPASESATPKQVTTDGRSFTTGTPDDDISLGTLGTSDQVWLALRVVDKTTGNLATSSTATGDRMVRFAYYKGTTAPSTFDGTSAGGWTTITHPDTTVTETPLSSLLVANNTGMIGVYVQSATDANRGAIGKFSNFLLHFNDGTPDVTFESASGDTMAATTNYLRSQYQVWWGTQDITDDFFSYNQTNDSLRLATEDWFFQTREFWSQSRWWNEDIHAPTTLTAASAATASWGLAGPPTNNKLIEKDDSANPGSGSAINTTNLANHTIRRLWAKTTVLTLNLRALQDYIMTRTLANATNDPADSGSALLKSSFNGLVYVARTNRAPWVPDLNHALPATPPSGYPLSYYGRGLLFDADNRCWLSNLFNYGAAWANGNDNYDNFTSVPPYDPYTRGAAGYNGDLTTPGTWGSTAAVPDDVAASLVPSVNGYNNRITPRLRSVDFHHGVRIRNGSSIDWNYPTSGTKVFGTTKLSIVTPNQLYLWGDFNSVAPSVQMADGSFKTRPAPVAVMGDAITLLSNSFADATFKTDFPLAVNHRTVTANTGILSDLYGPTASTTTYNTCLLTHNLPTSKASTRFGEASSFVNTMLFLEDWKDKTMNYTGSLVVMNSRRYSQAYLLDQAKVFGRTPFGWAGWNARSTSTATVAVPDGSNTFYSGTGYLDWVYGSSTSKVANTSNEIVPYTTPASLTGGKTRATAPAYSSTIPDGIPPIYYQPSRNMTFNDDLRTAEGTPPFTPFGQTIKGLGAWSRVVQ